MSINIDDNESAFSTDSVRIVFEKRNKVDFESAIISAMEAALQIGLSLQFGSDFGGMPNALSLFFSQSKNIKTEITVEHRAWLLISGSLAFAFQKVIEKTTLLIHPSDRSKADFVRSIAGKCEDASYVISGDFFERPEKHPIVEDVSQIYSIWLRNLGSNLDENEVCEIMRQNFKYGLHRSWLKNPDLFEPILKRLSSPFSAGMLAEHRIQSHLQQIDDDFTLEKLIGQDDDGRETITLGQVFVGLRAYNEFEKDIELTTGRNSTGKLIENRVRDVECHVFDLFDSLKHWIFNSGNKDVLRVISGGPGIGKSSSMRAFASIAARSGAVLPFILPLQKLGKPEKNLRERIQDFSQNNKVGALRKSPLDLSWSENFNGPILLIFDGLDELVRPGKDANEIARDFMHELRTVLDEENMLRSSPRKILSLVTGRISIAESAGKALKLSNSQVIHLLGFEPIVENGRSNLSIRGNRVSDPSNLLAIDQRILWWKKWTVASSDAPKAMPSALREANLREVTTEPLLLYFIAYTKAYDLDVGQKSISRNKLYDKLLRKFYERECSKKIRNIAAELENYESYEIILQSMAFAAWYDGSTRTSTIDLVMKLLESWAPGVAESFDRIIGSEKPAAGAALAFYTKPGERPNSYEFLHKTFAEYLVARRIISEIEFITSQFENSETSKIYNRKIFDIKEYLTSWLILCGPRTIDRDLKNFLSEEIANVAYFNEESILSWIDCVSAMLKSACSDGLPGYILFHGEDAKLVRRALHFRDAIDQCRNAELMMLAFLNGCILTRINKNSFKAVDFCGDLNDRFAMGNFLNRLRTQRDGPNTMLGSILSGISWRGQILHIQDFYGYELIKSDFSNAHLHYSNMSSANLDGSDLTGAELEGVDLSRAKLKKVRTNHRSIKAYLDKNNSSSKGDRSRRIIDDVNLSKVDLSDIILVD